MINKETKRAAASARPLCSIVIIQCTEQEHQVRSEEHLHQHGRSGRSVLERSRLKIPMMDFASITYLPDTRSKSKSNLEMSLTKDFTLSIELEKSVLFFMFVILPVIWLTLDLLPSFNSFILPSGGKKSMRKHTKDKSGIFVIFNNKDEKKGVWHKKKR